MKIYVINENMSFDVYYKKTQQFARDLVKAEERIKEWKNQQKLQSKQSALQFERKTMMTTTAVTCEATKSVLIDIIGYICNKKEHLVKDCSNKLKKTETKAVKSDYSDLKNELL